MSNNEFTCARAECGTVAKRSTHNQKYCSHECCRVETNRKIMEKYHKKVSIRKGLKRTCASCQTTSLSRYNDGDFCSACVKKDRQTSDASLNGVLNSLVLL